jgi:hypothetical protein
MIQVISAYNLKKTFQFIFFLLVTSCLSPIDIATDKVGGTIVIAGQVSTQAGRSTVQIGSAADKNRLPIPISGAAVILEDNDGNTFIYHGIDSNPGTYELANDYIQAGKFYRIEVVLPNGSIYKSSIEQIPIEVGSISSVDYEVVKDKVLDSGGALVTQSFINIFCTSNLPEKTNNNNAYLKWSVEETYLFSPTDFPDPFGSIPPPCYITQNADPQRIVLFDNLNSTTRLIEKQLVASRIIDFSFLEKHYFTCYQTALTKEAYEYWRKVDVVANQVGSIFDTPPAKIKGNVFNTADSKEEVLGYFQAVNESYDRFYTLPYLLPFEVNATKCDFTGSFSNLDYPSRCIDCLSIRNSSYNRPNWF